MTPILIPFGGACLLMYLAGTLMILGAFALDCVDAEKHGSTATGLFCGGFLFMSVASLLTLVAFFVYFSNGGV